MKRAGGRKDCLTLSRTRSKIIQRRTPFQQENIGGILFHMPLPFPDIGPRHESIRHFQTVRAGDTIGAGGCVQKSYRATRGLRFDGLHTRELSRRSRA